MSASQLRRRAALIAAALALGGCGGEEELPSGPPADVLFGFNDEAIRSGLLSADRDAALAARAGAEVSRTTFDWRVVEQQPDVYRFEEYDGIYRALLRRRIRPLWIVMFAPAWARDPGVPCPADCRVPPARAAEGEWAELLALIAKRYPRSAGIEIWNEPNQTQFWQPRPDPAHFARLLRIGYRAVKRARPSMAVTMGGLSNNDVTDAQGNISLEDFLRALYEQDAQRFTDAIAFHPYPARRSEPQLVRSVLQVLDLQADFGDVRRPLWVTELGVTTTGSDPDLRFDERQQEQVLVEAYEKLVRVPGVEMVVVHTLMDRPGGPANPEVGYGLLRGDGSPKPAFCALARATGARRCEAPLSPRGG